MRGKGGGGGETEEMTTVTGEAIMRLAPEIGGAIGDDAQVAGGIGVLSQLEARVPFRRVLEETLPGFAG